MQKSKMKAGQVYLVRYSTYGAPKRAVYCPERDAEAGQRSSFDGTPTVVLCYEGEDKPRRIASRKVMTVEAYEAEQAEEAKRAERAVREHRAQVEAVKRAAKPLATRLNAALTAAGANHYGSAAVVTFYATNTERTNYAVRFEVTPVQAERLAVWLEAGAEEAP